MSSAATARCVARVERFHGREGTKRVFARVLGGAFLASCPSRAATLEERVHASESRHAELYHTLEEKKTAGRMSAISERISLPRWLDGKELVINLHSDRVFFAEERTMVTRAGTPKEEVADGASTAA